MVNVRIKKKTRGIHSFYRAEIQDRILFGLIKYWTPFEVFENSGTIMYMCSNWDRGTSCPESQIKLYSELTGKDIRYDEPIPQ